MTQPFTNYTELCEHIERDIRLPTPPVIALKILETIQDNQDCMTKLVQIISADLALTAKMLRLANSSFYSLKRKVTSIERAVSVLGTNLIKNIALSFVLASDLREDLQVGSFDYDYFWRRSVTSAVTANLLCQLLGYKDEDIFVTALLHDIGILIAYQTHRDTYTALLQQAREEKIDLIWLEKQKFGFDHQQIAFTLLRKWNLPDDFAWSIVYHHTPSLAPQIVRNRTSVINIADKIAAIYTTAGNSDQIPEIKHQLCENFQLRPHIITTFLDEAALKSIEILDSFEIPDGGMKPYSQLLQEANEELGRLNVSYEQLVLELKEAKEKSEQLTEQLRTANIRLNTLVFTDGLTGLYNHRYFQQALANALAQSSQEHSPLSLILFDLDHFKNINDTYGHPVGDQVLNNLAISVRDIIRPNDVLARYGGEEFAIILPYTDFSGVKIFAERLRLCVENTVTRHERGNIRGTISIGATSYQPWEQKISQDLLIKTADRGLYMSKHNGRNTVTALLP